MQYAFFALYTKLWFYHEFSGKD